LLDLVWRLTRETTDEQQVVSILEALPRDALVVTVRHHGEPFNPGLHQLAALTDMRSQRRKHGYGLHLMQRLVDDVRFKANGRKSEVRLTKLRRDPG